MTVSVMVVLGGELTGIGVLKGRRRVGVEVERTNKGTCCSGVDSIG